MIPYDIDPSLHTAEPESPLLEDGFSPPHRVEPPANAETPTPYNAAEVEKRLLDKSPF